MTHWEAVTCDRVADLLAHMFGAGLYRQCAGDGDYLSLEITARRR